MILVCILLFLSISGCVSTNTSHIAIANVKPPLKSSNQENWQLMIGKWYGKQPTKDGRIRQELINRNANGTYIIQFLTANKDGSTKLQVEVGHWGISGSVYFSIFRGWLDAEGQLSPANPSNPYSYDAYHVIELTEKKFRYKHASTGSEYTIVKVTSDFELKAQ